MAGEIFISRENLDKLGVDPVQNTVTLTSIDTEFSFTVPDNTVRLIFGMRSGSFNFQYGWATGALEFTVPAGAFRDISDVYLVGETIFFTVGAGGINSVIEIESWT